MKKQIIYKGLLFLLLFVCQVCFVDGQNTNKRPDSWSVKIENPYLKNLWKVNDTLFRSEQPDKIDFAYINSLGFKSILNLRSKHLDKGFIGNLNIIEYNVEMEANDFTEKEIIDALKVIRSSPKPLLVHCYHGSDRTGVIMAMYRIIFQNWTKEQALNELLDGGYGFHTSYKNITNYIKNANIEKIKKKVLK